MLRFVVVLCVGVTAWAATEAEARVDAVFKAYTKPGSPGCAVGVLQRGETVLAKGYGMADLEQGVALTPRSRFYMASVSKQFAAMSILLAEKEGKLRLDDSIRKWVPEMPAYAEGITIRRMLDHTAGLRDYLALWGLRGFNNESVLKEGASLALLTRQKGLNFPTGTDYDYSNSGYLLAAVALQRATGKPLAVYAKEKIYQPLEMHASRFQADHSEPIPDRAHGYLQRDGGWKTADVAFDVVGSGGMYSNVEDMLRWARNFETPTVGGDLLKTLQTPGKLVDGRPTPGGYALGIVSSNGRFVHGGGAVGYSTFFLRIPKSEVTVVCLCNVGGAPVGELATKVAAVYTGTTEKEPEEEAPKERAPVAWKAGEMAKLAGSYWSEELFSVWQLAERNGGLYVQTDGAEFPVKPMGDGKYRAGFFELKMVNGGLDVSAGRARGIRFVRR